MRRVFGIGEPSPTGRWVERAEGDRIDPTDQLTLNTSVDTQSRDVFSDIGSLYDGWVCCGVAGWSAAVADLRVRRGLLAYRARYPELA